MGREGALDSQVATGTLGVAQSFLKGSYLLCCHILDVGSCMGMGGLCLSLCKKSRVFFLSLHLDGLGILELIGNLIEDVCIGVQWVSERCVV